MDAGQVEGSHVGHQISKYGRFPRIGDRPPVVQHYGPRRGHSSERKGSADHVRRRLGDMFGHLHLTLPHSQPDCEGQHEAFPGSWGGPFYTVKWIRSHFPENCVRPIPHQILSEHGGAHQGERAEHLCIELPRVPGCTLHSLGAHEPPGCAQRAERLPSLQRDQGSAQPWARIMHRLRVGVWRCMFVPTECECGRRVSIHGTSCSPALHAQTISSP